MPARFSTSRADRQHTRRVANREGEVKEVRLPISALLARIRRLIPHAQDVHYDEILRGFGTGSLRPPPTPMSDAELARAISDFLKDAPTATALSSLGRKLDPSSGL
jgi:hypothetical protein